MKNYLKPVIFYCSNSKYGALDGRVRYWHIVKHQCYPKGCIDSKGTHFTPNLLISTAEFKHYEHEYQLFKKWVDGLKRKYRVSLLGVIHRILPYLEVSMVGETVLSILRGYVLVYNECMIDNTFCEDRIYVVIDKEWLNQLQLSEEDTVSCSGRFDMDERGLISIIPANEVRRVFPTSAYKPWQPHLITQVKPFLPDYLFQDKCMVCDYNLFATKWRQSQNVHANWLCCLAGEGCKLGSDWE